MTFADFKSSLRAADSEIRALADKFRHRKEWGETSPFLAETLRNAAAELLRAADLREAREESA